MGKLMIIKYLTKCKANNYLQESSQSSHLWMKIPRKDRMERLGLSEEAINFQDLLIIQLWPHSELELIWHIYFAQNHQLRQSSHILQIWQCIQFLSWNRIIHLNKVSFKKFFKNGWKESKDGIKIFIHGLSGQDLVMTSTLINSSQFLCETCHKTVL